MVARGVVAAAGRFSAKPYLSGADWLWRPIPASPVLDTNSAAIVTALSSNPAPGNPLAGTANGFHQLQIVDYGVPLRGPSGVTTATPRFDIAFTHQNGGSAGMNWGPDPFSMTMPIPAGTPNAPGSDKHLGVMDPTTGQIFSLWQWNGTSGASWGCQVPMHGDGLERGGGSSTAARMSRPAGVIREAEIAAGKIEHALFFASNMIKPTTFRYPALNTDGANGTAEANPIEEGTRVQLNPSVNLDAISGITQMELIIGRALQKYGAYCGDQTTGPRMGFIMEYKGTTIAENQVYWDAMAGGAQGDYFDMPRIPWNQLRVLRQWDGG